MDALHMLEKRVSDLIERLKQLKIENDLLVKENNDLRHQVESMETSLLHGKAVVEEEKTLTKLLLDDLIKNIDSLVSSDEKQ